MYTLIAPPPLAGVGMAIIPTYILLAIGNRYINGGVMFLSFFQGQPVVTGYVPAGSHIQNTTGISNTAFPFLMNILYPVLLPYDDSNSYGSGGFDNYPESYNDWTDGAEVSPDDAAGARIGRAGLIFMCVSSSLLLIATKLFYPKEESNKDRQVNYVVFFPDSSCRPLRHCNLFQRLLVCAPI